MDRPVAAVLSSAIVLLAGCGGQLSAGEWGTFRYFGEIQGEPPMRLIPPASDRDGNVYVLYGNTERAEHTIFVGHATGGWSGGCSAQRGDFGVHGFTGRSDNRVWYWAGDALVAVDGDTGSCHELLSQDPVTGTELIFLGVVPWVDDTPSRTRLLALVQGATDSLPYYVVIDLDLETYTNPVAFVPENAQELVVLGTGMDEASLEGIFVVSYVSDGTRVNQVHYVDTEGELVRTVNLDLQESYDAYAIQGFVQVADNGLAAAVSSDSSLLIFNQQQGGTKVVSDFEPSGLLRWGGEIWVTGIQGANPVASLLDKNGSMGAVKTWSTSVSAADRLAGGITVLDERSDPSRQTDWNDAQTAIGTWPMISAWPLDVYTTRATAWLVAGPGYSTGNEDMTSVAFAPLGLATP